MKYTIRLSINVPSETIDDFIAAGWIFEAPEDSPVVSGAIVDSKLLWPFEGAPVVPEGHSMSGPDKEGFCIADNLADMTI